MLKELVAEEDIVPGHEVASFKTVVEIRRIFYFSQWESDIKADRI